MKYIILILCLVALVISILFITGCSRCSFNAGIGYRSVPPTLPKPIIHQLQAIQSLGFSPVYIDLIMKFLESGGLEVLFHKENRTDLGIWVDFLVD